MFFLHSSAAHAFVLTRKAKQGYSFSGPDSTVSWESVKVVKYLVASTLLSDSAEETCPVCLDRFSCARITKCGHCFCLPCLLRHVHTATATNPYQLVKCPCCALPVHVDDARPVVVESIQSPRLHSRIKFAKLHRAKDCSSPFIPQIGAMKHSSPHFCPVQTDCDAAFSRFNYVENAVYHLQLSANQLELEEKEKELHPTDMEILFVQMALERVKNDIQKALEETEEEQQLMERFQQPQTGMYQPISRHLLARDERNSIEEKYIEHATTSDAAELCSVRGNSMGSESDRLGLPKHGYSMDSSDSHEHPYPRKSLRQLPRVLGSMYLDEGSTQFYQAVDGQLCFLSKFNMQCLSVEFSVKPPEEPIGENLTALQLRNLQPLPDEVEGSILEIQHVHLTHEVRKRMPFLAHLPLYIDVTFVELDLNRILSEATKQKFKGEFEKRRKRRKDKKNVEKREDRVAQQKEQERINTLKSRVPRIDPNDEFFIFPEPESLTVMDFPSVSGDQAMPNSPATRPLAMTGISFSAIVNAPSAAAMTQDAFPMLGANSITSSTPSQQPKWGRGWHATNSIPKSFEDELSTSPAQGSNSDVGKGKKSKGKKIHLFSTGGQRGY